MKIGKFEMMRMQCLYDREVEFDLSETTVLPLRVSELLYGVDDVERFISNELRYPESKGSQLFRERIAQFYMDCKPENITVTNGGSEANYLTLWLNTGFIPRRSTSGRSRLWNDSQRRFATGEQARTAGKKKSRLGCIGRSAS